MHPAAVFFSLLTIHLSWTSIQASGGIKVGVPSKRGQGELVLPIDCDISGTRTTTVKPTGLNSGVVVKCIRKKVRGNEIHIWIVATPPHGKYKSPVCPELKLGRVKAGVYELFYDSPDKSVNSLGKIRIDP